MIPFAVLGVGIWNLRKWAVWSLLILTVIDLIFYIVFPAASRYIAGNSFVLLAIVPSICTVLWEISLSLRLDPGSTVFHEFVETDSK